jgi:hypothetical protein
MKTAALLHCCILHFMGNVEYTKYFVGYWDYYCLYACVLSIAGACGYFNYGNLCVHSLLHIQFTVKYGRTVLIVLEFDANAADIYI